MRQKFMFSATLALFGILLASDNSIGQQQKIIDSAPRGVGLLAQATNDIREEYFYGRHKTRPDASPRAMVMQVIGVDSEISITYHRPAVRGRDVWTGDSLIKRIGRLVPFDEDPRPWRAGANEATAIRCDDDVLIEGKRLSAGTYGLFMIPRADHWTVVFNHNYEQWGSFNYDRNEDALRVDVTPRTDVHQERLTYGFEDIKIGSCTAFLHWEKVKIPFRIVLADRDAERKKHAR